MKKRMFFLPFILLAVIFAGGCNGETGEIENDPKEEVKIPVILTIDPSTGNKYGEAVVEEFNRLYDGQYELDVEWVMETDSEYMQSLKRLNAADKLPAIIANLKTMPSFYERMVEEGRIEEISDYIMEDEEWRALIEEDALNSCIEEDGKIYAVPGDRFFSCSGIFYNERLFEIAKIESFPETWEEFWECCEILKRCGIEPIALHTEGTARVPMLFATAELSDTEEGMEFMETMYPESYRNENGLRLAASLKKLFYYSGRGVLYSGFDVAYTSFYSGRAAMIAGDYRMIEGIPENWKDKVRFVPFPGNKLISSPESRSWSVVSGYSDEIKKGAIEFLKLSNKAESMKKEQVFSASVPSPVKALRDYIGIYKNSPRFVPDYQVKWNSVVQEEMLEECIPELINEGITEKEFTQKADAGIRKYESER